MRFFLGAMVLGAIIANEAYAGSSVLDRRFLVHDGGEREYYLHRPREQMGEDQPLIIVLHGMGGQAKKLRFGLGLNALADAQGFAVAYPQGLATDRVSWHWNAGFDFSDVDDLGFLLALRAELVAAYDFDPARIYVFGISNGGYMAYHLACRAGEAFAGIAVISATMSGKDWAECAPDAAPSVLHIHGRNDPLIDYEGSAHWSGKWDGTPKIPEIVRFWGDQIKGRAAPWPVDVPDSETLLWVAPETGRRAALITLNAFGHDWPHQGNAGFDSNKLIWRFFEQSTQDRPERVRRGRQKKKAAPKDATF